MFSSSNRINFVITYKIKEKNVETVKILYKRKQSQKNKTKDYIVCSQMI